MLNRCGGPEFGAAHDLADRDPAPEVAPCRAARSLRAGGRPARRASDPASAAGSPIPGGLRHHRRLRRLRGHRRLGRGASRFPPPAPALRARRARRALAHHPDEPDQSRALRRRLRGLGPGKLAGEGRSRGDRRQDLAPQPRPQPGRRAAAPRLRLRHRHPAGAGPGGGTRQGERARRDPAAARTARRRAAGACRCLRRRLAAGPRQPGGRGGPPEGRASMFATRSSRCSGLPCRTAAR